MPLVVVASLCGPAVPAHRQAVGSTPVECVRVSGVDIPCCIYVAYDITLQHDSKATSLFEETAFFLEPTRRDRLHPQAKVFN